MNVQLLTLRDVRQLLPRSRSTLYAEIARQLFPRPIKIGRGSFWLEQEIVQLIAAYASGATEPELRQLCDDFYDQRRRSF